MRKLKWKDRDVKKKEERQGVILWITALAVMLSMALLVMRIFEYRVGEQKYRSLSSEMTIDIPIGVYERDTNPLPDDERIPRAKGVNYVYLKNVNPDYVAWLDMGPEVGVDYPIVQSGDDYYLKHNFYGEYNSNGCLLIDNANKPDFHDMHTLVWGHNMRSKAMFGRLQDYRSEAYYQEHPYFWIYTKDEALLYKIVSVHDVRTDSPAFYVELEAEEYQEQFLDAMYDKPMYETEMVESKYRTYTTLCTCDGNKKTRFMVHGRLIWVGSHAEAVSRQAAQKKSAAAVGETAEQETAESQDGE